MHHVQGLIASMDCLSANETLAPRAGNSADPIPANVQDVARQLSVRAPVAFIETSYFAGQGMQRSALWASGRLVRIWQPQAALMELSQFPINSAVREPGVVAKHGEFDTLELGRFRSNETGLASLDRSRTGSGN